MLSVEIISEFLTSERGAHGRALGGGAPAGRAVIASLATALRSRSPRSATGSSARPATPRPNCVGEERHRLHRLGDRQLRPLRHPDCSSTSSWSSLSVVVGFADRLRLALLSHRRRWLIPPLTGVTGVLYTIPSIAFFLLLLPITGRGDDTAIIALTLYTCRSSTATSSSGSPTFPARSKDAGRGMGMTDRQLLWKVELPLAVPEIIAGLRIATVSTVAIATLAVFAGGGGLGAEIYPDDITFKTGIVIAGGDRDRDGDRLRRRCYVGAPAAAVAVAAGEAGMSRCACRSPRSSTRSAARSTSSSASASRSARRRQPVGGLAQVLGLHVDADLDQRAGARSRRCAIALPIGLYFGHRGTGRAARGRARQRGPGDPGAGPDRVHGGVRRASASST